jgi:predicted dehydrogenase
VRVGFIGLGRAARVFHLPALRAIAGVSVVGGCDESSEQRASWQRETQLPAYVDVDELFAQAAPDIVVVATPPDSHADLCVRALEGGAHVVCEKPFVPAVEDADRVLAAAAAAGRQVAVNHQFREQPIVKAIKERIEAQEFGRLVFCQIWQLVDLAPWAEPEVWRAAMANRTLFEGGVHLVDLMLTFYGEAPTAVYARHSAGYHKGGDADAIHLVTLEFSEGRLAQIIIDRLCRGGTRYLEVRADCEHASLRASLGGRAVIQIGKKRAESTGIRADFGSGGLAWVEQGLKRKTLARNSRDMGVQGTRRLIEKFVEAVKDGREPPSSGREARQVISVIEAAYRSAHTGMRVELASDLHDPTISPVG